MSHISAACPGHVAPTFPRATSARTARSGVIGDGSQIRQATNRKFASRKQSRVSKLVALVIAIGCPLFF